MELRWYGQNSFLIKEGKLRVAIDPNEALTKELDADDVVITTSSAVSTKGVKSTVFDWPGEYETKGVLVYSIPIALGKDEKRVLSFEIEGIRFCNLGDLKEPLTEEIIAELGNVDILMLPMTLKIKYGLELAEEIDPRMVVPCWFGEEGTSSVGELMKEVGQAGAAEEEKLVIKQKSELDAENTVYKLLSRS